VLRLDIGSKCRGGGNGSDKKTKDHERHDQGKAMPELLDAWGIDYFSFVVGAGWATAFCAVSWCSIVALSSFAARDKSQSKRARQVLTKRRQW